MNYRDYADLIRGHKNLDLKKLSYQLDETDMQELIQISSDLLMHDLPLTDMRGKSLTIMPEQVRVQVNHLRVLLTPQDKQYSLDSMTDEIQSTLGIENIHTTRQSVRKILNGQAPSNDSEKAVYQLKLGLDYISNPANEMNEGNILYLYQTVILNQLADDQKPSAETGYRDDVVYVADGRMDKPPVHTGISYEELPKRIRELVRFTEDHGSLDDLTVAAILHFYLAYLHPWFDGNGRMARLLHMWYLVQKGYPSAMYTPFSQYIEASRGDYYQTFQTIDQNRKFLNVVDVTPFVYYFSTKVYNKISLASDQDSIQIYETAITDGLVTLKERSLWAFVISAYGTREFSTKELERDYGDAAYQTIYKFVHKFKKLGLLTSKRYGNRVRYRIAG